jgi:hypothetical protein
MSTFTGLTRVQRTLLAVLICLGLLLFGTSRTTRAEPTPLAACQASWTTMPTVASAYANGWLLCVVADDYTGGEQVYQETSVGSGVFNFVHGGGGWYQPYALETYAGVDPDDAADLVQTVSAQLTITRIGIPNDIQCPPSVCSGIYARKRP